jgi:hypothetical protein
MGKRWSWWVEGFNQIKRGFDPGRLKFGRKHAFVVELLTLRGGAIRVTLDWEEESKAKLWENDIFAAGDGEERVWTRSP